MTTWFNNYHHSEVPEISAKIGKLRHYRSYIQNSMKYGKSNSTAEGRNRAIKEIKRNSYGNHSFENFRKRILLAYGPVRFSKETYTIFDEKRQTEAAKAKIKNACSTSATPGGTES